MIIDNPIVSGSLNVQNDVTASNLAIASTASAAYFTGSFIGDGTQLSGVTSYTDADTLDYINTLGVLSGSAQIATDISGAFASTSQSLAERIASQESFSQSLDATFATDQQVADAVSALNNATSSYALQADISGAFADTSSSLAQRITAQEGFSSSLDATFATDQQLSDVSGALALSISNISTDFADITNKPTLISSSAQFTDLTAPFTGSFTGSFIGDGSQLSGVTSYTDADTLAYINSRAVLSGSIAELTAVTASFLNTGSVTIPHSFNSKNVSVSVYDSNDILIIPQEIALISNNAVKLTFGGSTSGFAVVSKGGHIVSGSVPVPQLSTVTSAFTSTTSHTVTHNFNTKEVIVSVYENDSLIIPDTVTTDDVNNVTVTFPEAISGRVVVVKAGHIVSGSIPFDNLLDSPFVQSATAVTASKSIVPSQDITYDLGSSNKRFRDLYLSSASIYLGNTVISEDNVVTTASLASALPPGVMSGSNQMAGETIDGDLTITGTMTAKEFHTEYVSASIVYQSGSTKFGDTADDTHEFTGSIKILGDTDHTFLDFNATSYGEMQYKVKGIRTFGFETYNTSDINTVFTNSGTGGHKVGIGTTSPSSLLHILGSTPTVKVEGTSTDSAKIDLVGTFTTWSLENQYVNGQTNDMFRLYNSALGADAITVNRSTNNVGIGTTSPSQKLHVAGGNILVNNGNTAEIHLRDSSNYIYGDLNGVLIAAADNNLRFRTNSGERLRIDSNGNVGIGTTSPERFLHIFTSNIQIGAVIQSSNATSAQLNFKNASTTGVGGFVKTTGDNIVLTANNTGASHLVVASGGNVGIGTTSPNQLLHLDHSGDKNAAIQLGDITTISSNTGIYFRTTGNAYISTASTGTHIFDKAGTERMRINANGNVGIGATDPLRTLHVVGNIAINAATTQYYGILLNGQGEGANPSMTIGDWHNASATIKWDSTARALVLDTQYSTGAGTFKITGNDEASTFFTINSSGSVGIGVTSPAHKLHIGTAYNDTIVLDDARSSGDTGQRFDSSIVWDAYYDQAARISLEHNDFNVGYRKLKFQVSGTTPGTYNDGIVLQQNGNVGIGTSSPNAILHAGSTGTNAYSTTITKGSNMKGIVTTVASNADDMVGIYFGTGTTTEGTHWSGITGARSNNASHWGTQLNFYTHDNNVNALNDATQKMVIMGDGNVGIGETSPAAKLHIRDAGGGILRLDRNDTSGATGEVLGKVDFWGNDFSGTGYDSRGFVQVAYQDAFARTYMSFGTGTYNQTASEKMRITSDGDVGIGTTNPSGRVHVVSDTTSNSGMTNHNGTNTHSVSGVKPGSTSQKLRVFVENYSTGLLNFSYAHTNSGSCGASLLVYINNSYGIIATNTIHSDLTFCQGTISISTYSPGGGASGAFYEITMPTGNGSPAYWAATITGAGNFYFNVI